MNHLTTPVLFLAVLALASVAACTRDRDPAAPSSVNPEGPKGVQCIDNGCCGLCAPGPDASQDDSLSVVCTPSLVAPSAAVTCTVSVSSGSTFAGPGFPSFQVDIRSLEPDPQGAFTSFRLPENTGQMNPGMTSWTMTGPAIFSAVVTVTALVNRPQGFGGFVTRSTVFEIDWGPEHVMLLPARPVELASTLDSTVKLTFDRQANRPAYDLQFGEWIDPTIDGGLGPITDGMAATNLANSLPVDSALTGPNTGYKRLRNPLVFLAPAARTHPAIYGLGPFARDQNGVDETTGATQSNGLPYCGSSVFPALRTMTLRHEGILPGAPSHYDIYQNTLSVRHGGEALRRLFYPIGANGRAMRDKINRSLIAFLGLDGALHRALDSTDIANRDANLGCALDRYPD